MPFTPRERKKIADIINEAIANTEFHKYKVTARHIDPDDNYMHGTGLIKWADSNNNTTSKVFNEKSKNRFNDFGKFFHFKSVSRTIDIINSKSIQISNLFSNDENDFSEYSEFFKRAGLFRNLNPINICHQIQNNIYDPAAPSKIDNERNNIFILCFTKSLTEERFWKNYSNEDTGVALEFRFTRFDVQHIFDFYVRDVCYDDGYTFDFINHINYKLAKNFNRHLFVEGLDKFAKFYKRAKYKWEDETRLVFHYNYGLGAFSNGPRLERIFPINTDPINASRRFLTIPLEGNVAMTNPMFSLKLERVVCGRKVKQNEINQIKVAIRGSLPNVGIDQR